MDEFVFETEKVRQPPRTSPQAAALAPSTRMAEVSQEVAAASNLLIMLPKASAISHFVMSIEVVFT